MFISPQVTLPKGFRVPLVGLNFCFDRLYTNFSFRTDFKLQSPDVLTGTTHTTIQEPTVTMFYTGSTNLWISQNSRVQLSMNLNPKVLTAPTVSFRTAIQIRILVLIRQFIFYKTVNIFSIPSEISPDSVVHISDTVIYSLQTELRFMLLLFTLK